MRNFNGFSGRDNAAELVDVLRRVRDVFADNTMDYRVIGGLALELQGIDVGTKDVDFLVDADQFDTGSRLISAIAIPQKLTADGLRVDAAMPSTYIFTGSDSIDRPVTFFRINNVDIDLLAATGPTEQSAMEDVPMLTIEPRGIPVATIPAIAAIKLSVGRQKDFTHIEMIATALGRKRSEAILRYLQTKERLSDLTDLAEEWSAAVERSAANLPRKG